MAKGRKTGGRTAGTPNRLNSAVGVTLADLGGPQGEVYAQRLHTIATSTEVDVHAQLKALSLIAPYVWGKPPEHVTLTGEDGGPLTVLHKHVTVAA